MSSWLSRTRSIDRAILAGVEGLDHSLKLPSDQERLLSRISDLAAADPDIGPLLPNLSASLRRVVQRLDNESINVPLTHPATGQAIPIAVGVFDLNNSRSMPAPIAFPALPS